MPNLSKLRNSVEKFYWTHGQNLIVATEEVMQGNDYFLSVCLYDPDTDKVGDWLFDIKNYEAFYEWERPRANSFTDSLVQIYKNPPIIFDSVKAACTPRYTPEGEIMLYNFDSITYTDIERALRYFVRDILEDPFIFNMKVHHHKEDTCADDPQAGY